MTNPVDEFNTIEVLDIDVFVPDPANPRTITAEAQERLQKSIDTYGFVEPLVWNKRTGHIVAGHQRVDRAKELGYSQLPAVVVDWPLEKQRGYNLADNAEYGVWDDAALAKIIAELDQMGFDLSETALPQAQLEDALDAAEEILAAMNAADALDGEGEAGESGGGAELGESKGLGNPILSYTIIFENDMQQDTWFEFIRALKRGYTELETIAERLHVFCTDADVLAHLQDRADMIAAEGGDDTYLAS